MGAQLVGFVLANHGGLPPRSKVVLIKMAHTALDQPNRKGQPAGIYYGGWEPLALALGYEVPDLDPDNEKVCQQRRTAGQAVRRAVKPLVQLGVVERLTPSGKVHKGNRQVFRLHVFGPLRSSQ
jgi:hypothetical protein